MRHVIIGNGPAGVIAAETIRKANAGDSIQLLGDEPSAAYSRMAIPYLMMGHIGETGMHLRKDPDHFKRFQIETLTGRASSVDTAKGTVALDDGATLKFDRLLLATGSRPVTPPIPGIDLPGIHACWTLEDARAIMRLAKPGARVVQMGAGFIGCIILEALAASGVDLTVVEMGDRMVPRMMTETAGGLIKQWCESKGVKVLTGTKVQSFARAKGGGLEVHLDTGKSIPADLVISATGVRPNIELAKAMGLKTDVGVRVDAGMRSSHSSVYAAGDVAQAEEFYTRNYVVNAVQPNAADQARIAGINMAGGNARSGGALAINVLDTLGLIAASFGQWQGVPGGDKVELVDRAHFRYICLQFAGDRVVGATTLGLTEHVGVLRGLIQSARPLGRFKAMLHDDPLQLMKAYLGSTQAAA